ncbi:MAG: hypothetical protein PHW12_07695, partial [Smithella sp.]|nr:hypothetical protein [Smithella sp.]
KWRIITFSTLAENEQSEISNSQFLKEKELDITFFNDSMCQILMSKRVEKALRESEERYKTIFSKKAATDEVRQHY